MGFPARFGARYPVRFGGHLTLHSSNIRGRLLERLARGDSDTVNGLTGLIRQADSRLWK